MRTFILFASLLTSTAALAQAPANPDPKLEEHIQMHEKVGEAHKKVAECLRSGKPKDECGPVFHKECDEIRGSKGFCGKPHGKHKR